MCPKYPTLYLISNQYRGNTFSWCIKIELNNMELLKWIICYLCLVLVTAEGNETETSVFTKYPEITLGLITGLSILAIICTFCCCMLMGYICLRGEHSSGPSLIRSMTGSLRRRPEVIESHPTNLSTRRHTYEDIDFTSVNLKEPQPPIVPNTPRPSRIQQEPQASTSTAPTGIPQPKRVTNRPTPRKIRQHSQVSTSGAQTGIPQPKMGVKVQSVKAPKRKPKHAYVNLDPELVAAERILTCDTPAENFRDSFKRMISFRPLMLADKVFDTSLEANPPNSSDDHDETFF